MYYLNDQSFGDYLSLLVVFLCVLYVSFLFGSWRWLVLSFVLGSGLLVTQDLPKYEPVSATLESVNNNSLIYRLQDGSRVKIDYTSSNKALQENVVLYKKN